MGTTTTRKGLYKPTVGETGWGATFNASTDIVDWFLDERLANATGDILVASANDTWARLGIGTAGQVATVVAGTVAWATPGVTSHPDFFEHDLYATD